MDELKKLNQKFGLVKMMALFIKQKLMSSSTIYHPIRTRKKVPLSLVLVLTLTFTILAIPVTSAFPIVLKNWKTFHHSRVRGVSRISVIDETPKESMTYGKYGKSLLHIVKKREPFPKWKKFPSAY